MKQLVAWKLTPATTFPQQIISCSHEHSPMSRPPSPCPQATPSSKTSVPLRTLNLPLPRFRQTYPPDNNCSHCDAEPLKLNLDVQSSSNCGPTTEVSLPSAKDNSCPKPILRLLSETEVYFWNVSNWCRRCHVPQNKSIVTYLNRTQFIRWFMLAQIPVPS